MPQQLRDAGSAHQPCRAGVGRRTAAVAALLAFVGGLGPAPLPAQGPPNVLIVLADDLGVDFVGAYAEGAGLPATPNIDALAARGVLFRNAWANPSCSPTRGCIMTGRYPFRTLIGRWIDYPHNSGTVGTLRRSEITLPEVLDRAGGSHAHGYIGKWHLNYQSAGLRAPNDVGGWSHFAGKMKGMGSSDYYAWERVVNGAAATSHVYATTQQVDDALSWIQAQSGPWFCYFACLAPHLPMHAPPAHLHGQNLSGLNTNTHRTTFYKAVIEALDTELGRLFRGIGSELENTHVIFLGDNGSVQNMAVSPFDPSRAKGSPYEGGLNVPLIVAGPAVRSPGREVAALVSSVDVFGTALELAGALPALPTWVVTDGVSLVPYLQDPQQMPLRDHVFSEEFTGDTWPAPNLRGHATIRNDRYKLIHRYAGSDQLFDLVNDPWENVNLLARALSSVEQQNHAALLNRISALRTPLGHFRPVGSSGCIGSNGAVPQLTTSGLPRLAQRYAIDLANAAPLAPAFHLVGLDGLHWNGTPLPLDLSAFGGGGACLVHVSGHAAIPSTTSSSGQASGSLTVPITSTLVGRTVFHQWVVVDPGAPGNGLGIVTSNAVAAVLGS